MLTSALTFAVKKSSHRISRGTSSSSVVSRYRAGSEVQPCLERMRLVIYQSNQIELSECSVNSAARRWIDTTCPFTGTHYMLSPKLSVPSYPNILGQWLL